MRSSVLLLDGRLRRSCLEKFFFLVPLLGCVPRLIVGITRCFSVLPGDSTGSRSSCGCAASLSERVRSFPIGGARALFIFANMGEALCGGLFKRE